MGETFPRERGKCWPSALAAVEDIKDEACILVGGFGNVGVPFQLLEALAIHGPHRLTVVANTCEIGEVGLSILFKLGLVSKVCASFPSQAGNHHFKASVDRGEVEVEVIPQGTLAERIRCAGAGLGGFYTRTGFGTELAANREARELGGIPYILELPLRGDVALIAADVADDVGNLRFRRSARNFNPIMAMAARLTIVQVNRIVPTGSIDPDDVHLPGIFVDRMVEAVPA